MPPAASESRLKMCLASRGTKRNLQIEMQEVFLAVATNCGNLPKLCQLLCELPGWEVRNIKLEGSFQIPGGMRH